MSSESKDEIQLNDYYILYLDILGYKSHMAKTNNDPETQKEFFNQIKYIVDDCYKKESEKKNGKSYIKVKVFSDNILFAIRVIKDSKQNDENIRRLCSIASRMQEMFLRRYGILFRGAITKGQLYIDDRFVFGQGIINAYELENNLALYPRILIDKGLESETYILDSRHRIDSDKLFDDYKFINFLCYYIPAEEYESNRDINVIKAKIENLIQNTTDTRALQKIKWAMNYVDNFINKYNL